MPEEWLEADIKQGIGNNDVENRRKRVGWNEIMTEKENLFIKFLMFFTGPILYGKSSSAPCTIPMLPSRYLRPQWLVGASGFAFAQAFRGKLGSYGRKHLGAPQTAEELPSVCRTAS